MLEPLRIVVGADDAGYDYKQVIADDLRQDAAVSAVEDLGVHPPDLTALTYGSVAIQAAERIRSGRADRAVLICGTGIGVAIAANKVPGIRAAVASDSFGVERSILSNDCQVLTLGQRVLGLELARRLVHEWLRYRFDPASSSAGKVAVIEAYENS